MRESGLLQPSQNLFDAADIYLARSKKVATADDFVPADLDQRNCFGITRLKSDGSASGDIQTISIRLFAIKMELWISLNKMVMRSNLNINELEQFTSRRRKQEIPESADHPYS